MIQQWRQNKKGALSRGRLFRRRLARVLFRLRRRLLVLLLEMLFLLLHHDIELFLLLVVERGADLADGAFANRVDFLDLVVARHRIVLYHVHGLGVLIFERCLYLCLLVGGKVQLLRQGLYLIVNAGVSRSRWALRLSCCPGLLARLCVLVLSGLRLRWLS